MLLIHRLKCFNEIGENSKIVVNGDPSQIDLSNKMSGLERSKNIISIE